MVRARILDGATRALAERGYNATVDHVATAAGVSRRTVFRHFPTHEAVMEAAIAEVLVRYERLMPVEPAAGTDLESWLEETAVALHDLNARLLGRAFWDLHVERPGMTPELRTRRRRGFSSQVAGQAWHLAGGEGSPPAWVVEAFALQMSPFATNCLEGYSTEEAGRISSLILSAVLTAAVTRPR